MQLNCSRANSVPIVVGVMYHVAKQLIGGRHGLGKRVKRTVETVHAIMANPGHDFKQGVEVLQLRAHPSKMLSSAATWKCKV